MRPRLAPLLLAIMIAGCASQKDRELEAVKSARSVLAEWAAVENQAAAGRAPAEYLAQTRQLARDQLETAVSELSGRAGAVRVLQSIVDGAPDARALTSARAALAPLEHDLESA